MLIYTSSSINRSCKSERSRWSITNLQTQVARSSIYDRNRIRGTQEAELRNSSVAVLLERAWLLAPLRTSFIAFRFLCALTHGRDRNVSLQKSVLFYTTNVPLRKSILFLHFTARINRRCLRAGTFPPLLSALAAMRDRVANLWWKWWCVKKNRNLYMRVMRQTSVN